MFTRRQLRAAGVAWPVMPALAAQDGAAALLREGSVVVALRHAPAPGTVDAPGFELGVCSTQRNLNDEARAQARRTGAWFQAAALQPARVRASPWCRCLDTATLVFGGAEPWDALGSPRSASDSTHAASLHALRDALVAASAPGKPFEAWVTHQSVLHSLVGSSTASGEGLLLRADASGTPRLLARLLVAA